MGFAKIVMQHKQNHSVLLAFQDKIYSLYVSGIPAVIFPFVYFDFGIFRLGILNRFRKYEVTLSFYL